MALLHANVATISAFLHTIIVDYIFPRLKRAKYVIPAYNFYYYSKKYLTP